MQIIVMCVMLTFMMFFVPSKYRKTFSYVSVFMLSALYLFFDPPTTYDLSRHYDIFEQLEKSAIKDIMSRNDTLQIYFQSYPLFTLYVWLVSRIHIKELLPFSIGIIVYGILIYMLNDMNRKRHFSKNVYAFGYAIVVQFVNFVSISGIRNVTVATVFVFTLYLEFVCKKKKIFCFIFYILCCLIHSVAWLYLAIRIALLFYNKIIKVFIRFFILFLFMIVPTISQSVLIKGLFERVLYLEKAYTIFTNYLSGGTGNANLRGIVYLSILLYLFSLCVAIFFKRTTAHFDEYKDFYDYFILSLCFTIGSYSQYDLFARYQMMIVPFLLCFWLEVINKIHRKGLRVVTGESKLETMAYLAIMISSFIVIAYIVAYRYIYQYYPLTSSF